MAKYKPKPPEFFFRMRTYPNVSHCEVWIIHRNNSFVSQVMHSAMNRAYAEKMFAALGVTPEIENSTLELEGR